jgi:hypothetical protein
MSTICLVGLSVEEAERALASMWRALEAYDVPTPQLLVEFFAGRITIRLLFQTDDGAADRVCRDWNPNDDLTAQWEPVRDRSTRLHLVAQMNESRENSAGATMSDGPKPYARGADGPPSLNLTLRERATQRARAFIEVMDSLDGSPKPREVDRLQKAADELMRACARVMIDLGRRAPRG